MRGNDVGMGWKRGLRLRLGLGLGIREDGQERGKCGGRSCEERVACLKLERGFFSKKIDRRCDLK
jgi:hypothetical protein